MPFFYRAGSVFEELYVGVGSRRCVRRQGAGLGQEGTRGSCCAEAGARRGLGSLATGRGTQFVGVGGLDGEGGSRSYMWAWAAGYASAVRVRSHDVTLRHVTSRRRLVTWPSNVTSGEGPGVTLPGPRYLVWTTCMGVSVKL